MKPMPGRSAENPIGSKWQRHAAVFSAGLLLMLAFCGAAGLATWHIHSASIDVAYSDTWRHMRLIEHFLGGTLDPSEIFAPSNQNRPALLKVSLLVSATYDHLDLKKIEYLSIFCITATVCLLAFYTNILFKRHRATFLLIFLCVSVLLFSLAQWENFLLPVNFVLFSMIAFSVGSILLMGRHLGRDRSVRGLSWDMAAAILLSELALFSMGGGVLVWPVNLIQIALSGMLHRRRVGWELALYGAVGTASLAFYLHGLEPHLNIGYVLSHLAELLEFVLVGLGNSVVGYLDNVPLPRTSLAVGVVLSFLYCAAALTYWKLDLHEQRRSLGILCLLLLGVAQELLIGFGRLTLGVAQAATSRYSTLTMVSAPAALILLALHARKSRASAALAGLLGVVMCGFAILADYGEFGMAESRRQYGENLRRILLQDHISDDDLRQLQSRSRSDVELGNRMLREFRLSFYHYQPAD
jgi:hypothetical protein